MSKSNTLHVWEGEVDLNRKDIAELILASLENYRSLSKSQIVSFLYIYNNHHTKLTGKDRLNIDFEIDGSTLTFASEEVEYIMSQLEDRGFIREGEKYYLTEKGREIVSELDKTSREYQRAQNILEKYHSGKNNLRIRAVQMSS